jgi:hypothetical protein
VVQARVLAVHVETQEHSEQHAEVLSPLARVVPTASVAKAGVQQSIRAEAVPDVVVVGERLWYEQQVAAGTQVGGCPEACDVVVPLGVRKGDEQQYIAGILGMEGQSDLALLVAAAVAPGTTKQRTGSTDQCCGGTPAPHQ